MMMQKILSLLWAGFLAVGVANASAPMLESAERADGLQVVSLSSSWSQNALENRPFARGADWVDDDDRCSHGCVVVVNGLLNVATTGVALGFVLVPWDLGNIVVSVMTGMTVLSYLAACSMPDCACWPSLECGLNLKVGGGLMSAAFVCSTCLALFDGPMFVNPASRNVPAFVFSCVSCLLSLSHAVQAYRTREH